MFDTEYDNAKIEPSDLPDGLYDVSVFDIELGEGEYGPYINWKLKIQTGEHAGKYLFHRRMINDKGLSFVKQDLVCCGYTGKLSELKDKMPELLGITLEVKKSTKQGKGANEGKTYKNISFRKQITLDDCIPF